MTGIHSDLLEVHGWKEMIVHTNALMQKKGAVNYYINFHPAYRSEEVLLLNDKQQFSFEKRVGKDTVDIEVAIGIQMIKEGAFKGKVPDETTLKELWRLHGNLTDPEEFANKVLSELWMRIGPIYDDSDEGKYVFVRRQLNDRRIGKVAFHLLKGLGWAYDFGGCYYIYGYIQCSDIKDGKVGHSCCHGNPPHTIKICVLPWDNEPNIYKDLLVKVGPQPRRLNPV